MDSLVVTGNLIIAVIVAEQAARHGIRLDGGTQARIGLSGRLRYD